tara:strand:- start:368 stop:565 length:198 start_codon:yes stop_codon:yes gene_type:complete
LNIRNLAKLREVLTKKIGIEMTILYIIALLFFVWILIASMMLLIKIILVLSDFYEDIKAIRKRGK